MAQKKEIKRLEKLREHEQREALEVQAEQDAEAQERAVKEFELLQAGFDVNRNRKTNPPKDEVKAELVRQDSTEKKTGEKRKFALDEDEVLRNAMDDRAKARKAIDAEKVHDHLMTWDERCLLTEYRAPNLFCHHFGSPRSSRHRTKRTNYTRSRRRPRVPQSALRLRRTTLTITLYTL